LAVGLGATIALWLLLLVTLFLLGHRLAARDIARFVPDCALLLKRLLGDPRVPRRAKIALALLVPYLALPLDLVPDFIPVVGQIDDAILVAIAVAYVVRSTSSGLVRELWPGSERNLRILLTAAGRIWTSG
jgi:uncharacterized membrane protein YkvA (DUF1232 family)